MDAAEFGGIEYAGSPVGIAALPRRPTRLRRRPYGTNCQHEHACLRCSQLHVNPSMLGRLDQLEADLEDRKRRATAQGWLGEIEGIHRTLECLVTNDPTRSD